MFIPKRLLEYFQISTEVEIALTEEGITIRKPRRALRLGWLAAAHALEIEERLEW